MNSYGLSAPLSDGLSSTLGGRFFWGEGGGGGGLNNYPWRLRLESDADVYGAANAPALDWQPESGVWDSAFGPTPTFARNSTATYKDENGIIQTAAVDEPRIDWKDGVCQGALIEPSAEQLVERTDFDGWFETSAITVEPGTGLSGFASVIVTSQDVDRRIYTNIPTTDDLTEYTGGFWIRRVAGSDPVSIFHSTSASGASTPIAITTDWSYVETTFRGRAGSGNVLFGVFLDETDNSVEISMPQVELGTVATSFIPNTTGSPVPRESDIVTIAGTDFTDIIGDGSKYTIYAEYVPRDIDGIGQAAFSLRGSSGADFVLSRLATGDIKTDVVSAGVTQIEYTISPSVDTVLRAALSLGAVGAQVAYNGAELASAGAVTAPISLDTLYIGNDEDAEQLNGHISRMIIWQNTQDELS